MDVNGMKITDIRLHEIKNRNPKSKLFAFADVILNDLYIIPSIRIFEGENGPFMVLPQNTGPEDTSKDGHKYQTCHPTTKELRSYIDEHVMVEYALTVNTK